MFIGFDFKQLLYENLKPEQAFKSLIHVDNNNDMTNKIVHQILFSVYYVRLGQDFEFVLQIYKGKTVAII
jgi:hypothetical protein